MSIGKPFLVKYLFKFFSSSTLSSFKSRFQSLFSGDAYLKFEFHPPRVIASFWARAMTTPAKVLKQEKIESQEFNLGSLVNDVSFPWCFAVSLWGNWTFIRYEISFITSLSCNPKSFRFHLICRFPRRNVFVADELLMSSSSSKFNVTSNEWKLISWLDMPMLT